MLRQDLERQRLFAKPERTHGRPAGSSRGLYLKWFDQSSSPLVANDPPLLSTRAYPCSDGHLATRGSILHVAIGKAQQKNRCLRDPSILSLPPRAQLLTIRQGTRLVFLVRAVRDSLHMDGQHVFFRAPSHAPTPTQASQGVANRRSDASSEVVFEVTVWKADDERSGGDKAPLLFVRRRVPESYRAQTRRIPVHLTGDKRPAHRHVHSGRRSRYTCVR